MKKKLVLWGANAQDEKVLIALELLDASNKVNITTFPNEIVSDDFYTKMMGDWRDNKEAVEFPEGHSQREIELSMSDGLLPEDLKTERTDLISRAQTEWHFIVLSNKLNKVYQDELVDLKEKVAKLTDFDKGTWEELKGFWGKVQSQVRERNLFRDHADSLRDGTNGLFEEMKTLRSKLNKEFEGRSEEVYKDFTSKLDNIYDRLESGNHRFAKVFDELKAIQREYKGAPLTGKHRNSLWDRIDGAFKKAKEARFGKESNQGSLADRLHKRLTGLESAQKRMEETIRRDVHELDYQNNRIESTFGQLEAQIRQAKLSMIEERLNSKKEKLEDIKKTYIKVKEQLEKAEAKEAAQQAANAEKKQIAEAKKAEKAKIAAEVAANAAAMAALATPKGEDKELEAVKEETVEVVKEADAPTPEEVIEEKMEAVEEAIEAAEEVEEKAEAATEAVEEVMEAVADEVDAESEAVLEEAAKAEENTGGSITEMISESLEDAVDTVKSIAVVAAQKAEEAVGDAVKKANEMVDDYVESKEEKKEESDEKDA